MISISKNKFQIHKNSHKNTHIDLRKFISIFFSSIKKFKSMQKQFFLSLKNWISKFHKLNWLTQHIIVVMAWWCCIYGGFDACVCVVLILNFKKFGTQQKRMRLFILIFNIIFLCIYIRVAGSFKTKMEVQKKEKKKINKYLIFLISFSFSLSVRSKMNDEKKEIKLN